MKLIALGGVPATGKSTIMRQFMKDIAEINGASWNDAKPVDLLYGHSIKHGDMELFIAGKYEDGEKFPGTDRLSMAVMPEAKKYIMDNKNREDLTMIFEGDRLFSHSFLEFAYDTLGEENVHIVMITANKEILDQRHHDRADTQNEQFLRSRVTKCSNIASDLVLQDCITEREHISGADTSSIVLLMKSFCTPPEEML